MSFANFYFELYKSFHREIKVDLSSIDIIVAIPAYNEPDIFDTLHSLLNARTCGKKILVLIVVNTRDSDNTQIQNQNFLIYQQIKQFAAINNSAEIYFEAIYEPNVAHKLAGAGYARKIAMDTALWLSNKYNSDSIIVSLDADTIVQPNYFEAITTFFSPKENFQAANIYFEHPLDTNRYDNDIIKAIKIYELYLRYFVEALRYTGFPYSYFTIGSAFAVRSSVYARSGGMVLNQAGEDFYFLQKIIPNFRFSEINQTTVFPSPRISDRIVFGTGVAVQKIIQQGLDAYHTYTFDAFDNLKYFFSLIPSIYELKDISMLQFDQSLKEFLELIQFSYKLQEIFANSANFKSFCKRFFHNFNYLTIIKYLNFYHHNYKPKDEIKLSCNKLFEQLKLPLQNNYEDFLYLLRKRHKQNIWIPDTYKF